MRFEYQTKMEDLGAADSDELDCKGEISLKYCIRTMRLKYQTKKDLGDADSDELDCKGTISLKVWTMRHEYQSKVDSHYVKESVDAWKGECLVTLMPEKTNVC